MIELLILLVIACVICYLAATYLPVPINWLICLVVIVILLLIVFGSGNSVNLNTR